MAVFEASFTKTVVVKGGKNIAGGKTYGSDGQDSREVPVPDSTTDLQVTVNIDVSKIQLILLLSDQDLTVETVNASTPTDTINLKANVAYVWTPDEYFANLFTADTVVLFLTNSSGAAATFHYELIQDMTP